MAYAVCTYTLEPITVFGNKRIHRVRFVVSSYELDGIRITPAIAGMSIIDGVLSSTIRTVVANGPVCLVWESSTQTLQALKATNGEVDQGTAFSADVFVMGS